MGWGDLLKPLIGPILEPFLRLIPDPNARAAAAESLEKQLVDAGNAQMQAQAEINKIEAASPSVFVAGWRPAIGWICGFGIGWAFVLKPMVEWGYFLYFKQPLTNAPTLDTNELMGLVTAMLGLAGYRTFEGVKGAKRDNLK